MRTGMFTIAVIAMMIAGCNTGAQRAPGKVLSDADRLYGEQRFAEAAADYGEYLRRCPADTPARIRYGRSLLKSGQPAEAREQLEVAYGVKLNSLEAYEELCEALFEAGRNDDLFRLLRQRTASPGAPADFLRLADYAMRLGDVDEARRALVTAATVDKGRNLEIHLALADLHRVLGDHDEEARRLRMAYFIAPRNTDVLARLRTLGIEPGVATALRPDEME